MSTYSTLLTAFKSLPVEQRKNLAWHARKKTPVLCGEHGTWWVIGRAG